MKSLPQLWQIRSPRDLFCVQVRKPLLVRKITAFQQTRLATQFQKTIDHVIPKVGGAILELEIIWRSNNLSGVLKWSYSQNNIFAYLNEGPFLTQSLTHLSGCNVDRTFTSGVDVRAQAYSLIIAA